MKGCKHPWQWIGETRQSENFWCFQCGAFKRFDKDSQKFKINHPRLADIQHKRT